MKRFYLFLIFTTIWLSACGTEAAKNENSGNVNVNQSNINAVNVNVNANANKTANAEEEKVPTFDDAQEALKKGEEYLDKNEVNKAIDALKQAVELDPDLADAHFRLGVAYGLQEAEEDAEVKTVEEETDSTPEPKNKKKTAEKEKKTNSQTSFENAVKAYKKYLVKNAEDAEAYYNLGRAYNKLGSKEDEEARKALEKAVKIDGENSLYRTELGSVLIELAKYPEAIKQLTKAIELDEDNLQAEDLLEQAKEGKKRTDFNKDKVKK